MQSVLCACLGNISRSPMMQMLLQHHLGPGFRVERAGVKEGLAGRPANHRSVTCLAERGIDLSGHRSRWVGDLDLARHQWIVTVGEDEAAQVRAAIGAGSAQILIANAGAGGVPDPYDHGLEGYRDCLALLDRVLPDVAERIRCD